MAKPRMVRGDKWKKRPSVMRYWAFKDEVRLKKVFLPVCNYHITFIIPMAESWSDKKKIKMNGQPHQQKPDKDNLEKALMDAVHDDDAKIWDGRVTKIWGIVGQIKITVAEDAK